MKNYKITITLVVSMSDENKRFFDESPADLIENVVQSEHIKLEVQETKEPAQALW